MARSSLALLGGAVLCLAGCLVPSPSPAQVPAFRRVVDSLDVRDAEGRPYAHPFLGGLDVPRPQLVDIDADGDLDLFIQERSGEISFFERVGGPGAPRFAWRTDRFQDLAVGEWFRFVDIDGDGDLDLLAEEPYSYIRLYLNRGSRADPRFLLAADSLRDLSGVPIFSDRQNIPNLADLDCNGRLDLFLGRVTGTVDRLEAGPAGPDGLPRFGLVAERFEGIEIIGNTPGGPPSMHGANTLAFADYDGDGDLDLFWGDFFEEGLLLIENTGSCRAPSLRSEPVRFPRGDPVLTSGYNAPSFGDLDGDGDLDLVLGVLGGAFVPNRTSVENLYLLEQAEGRQFTVRTRRLLGMVDVGSESIPALLDLDGDGDLDLLLANKIDPADLTTSKVYRFENTGSARHPAFRLAGALEFSGSFHYAPAAGDLDGDGDLDLVMGTWRDRLQYYRNDGTVTAPRWVPADTALVTLTRGSNATPALADIDGDGDLDLFVGEASGAINHYRNDGTRSAPAFVLVSDEYAGLDVGRRSFPALADIDRDGDLDLVVGSEAGTLTLVRNTGTRNAPIFGPAEPFPVPTQAYATPAFGDLDGDGDLDLVSGAAGGGLLLFLRND